MQKRAQTELGENGEMKPQSHPGVLQPLAAGKGQARELSMNTLLRETKEEVGESFVEILSGKISCNRELRRLPEKRYTDKNGDSVVNYNFLVEITDKDAGKIKLHAGAEPRLIFLKKEDLPRIKTTKEMKEAIKENDLVMFPDHLSVLKEIVGEVR